MAEPMQLKAGTRCRSQVDDTQLIVVRPVPGDVDLTCGGHPVIDQSGQPTPGLAVKPGADAGTLVGKRYTDASGKLEILVTKAGTATLAVGEEALTIKDAKPLPASD